MMALFHRERTGEGQEVEVPMFEALTAFMLVEHANGAMFSPPLGSAAYPRVIAPNRQPYKTKDGQVSALIYNDKHWQLFIDTVQPAWAEPELATLQQRAAQIDRVYGLLAQTFLERTTAEWLDLLHGLGIPAAPLNSPEALLTHPHLQAVEFFETVDSPYGPIRFPGVPTWFSKTPGRIGGPPPRLGEHTEELMGEIRLQALAQEGDSIDLPKDVQVSSIGD